MKLSKKLIPAIGMLMLSAVMLVTSSFAWFSMNTNVAVTGMTVSAKGDQVYLQIVAGTETTAFSSTEAQVTANGSTIANLQPVDVVASYDNDNTPSTVALTADIGSNYKWVYNNSSELSSPTATGDYKEAATTGYYLKQSFMIRLNQTAGKSVADGALRVSSVAFNNGTTPTDAFGKCVSVFVTCTDGSTTKNMLFKQDDSYKFTAITGDTFLNANNENKFANTSGVQVDVYVFFDGSDNNCTIANLEAAKVSGNYSTYSVDVNFTCA